MTGFLETCTVQPSFSCTVSITVLSASLNLFTAMCKQHHRTALNPFLKGAKKPVTLM